MFLFSTSALLASCDAATATLGRGVPGNAAPGSLDTGDTGQAPDEPTDPWTYQPGPEPSSPWTPEGYEDDAAFGYGVQTGDAEHTSVIISCRTEEPTVSLVLVRGVDDGWEEVGAFDDLVPDDRVVQIEITDLIPDTTYAVAMFATDGFRRSSPSRFRTALYPQTSRVVRFGAISCMGGNEPWEVMTRASEELFDFFLLLGDTIYADPPFGQAPQYEADWETALQVRGLRDLTQSTSVVGTWDDHEVEDNWNLEEPGMVVQALEALQSFRRAIPQRIGQAGSGMWRKLSWGDTLDIFVLDCRSERINGDYISQAQMDWLKQGLVDSDARFKIICNSVPITDMDDVYFGISAEDRWDGHQVQRTEILSHIRDSGVQGVLWLAGDFHWGAVSSIGAPGDDFDDQTEVFCGPGGSFINPIVLLLNPNDHYSSVIKAFNYTAFEADPDAGTIQLAFIDNNGNVIDSQTLYL
jgi:alkaline phosphatase D